MKTTYEWDAETVDVYGDIVNHDFHPTYAQVSHIKNTFPQWGEILVIVLVRDRWDDDGELVDRSWAYMVGGKLPESFDCGATVPVRFHKEVDVG